MKWGEKDMEQKANIINRLKEMGYSVGEDSGIYFIAIITNNRRVFGVHYGEEELIQYSGSMVDRIVSDINDLIKNWDEEDKYIKSPKSSSLNQFQVAHVERCFNIELYEHQKNYLLGKGNLKVGRRTGKTFAYCIALSLSEGEPLDISKPEKFSDEWSLYNHVAYSRTFFIKEFMKVRNALNSYGFKVRGVTS